MPTRPSWSAERLLWKQGYLRVAGVDEVGRGPLAGPVVAAAVVFPPSFRTRLLPGLRDSKQLTAMARERLAPQVRRFAAGFATGFEPWARKISAALFVLVLAGAILAERDNIVEYFAQAGLITLVLNVLMMVLAYIVARIFASGLQQRIAISLECGLQNGTLAIAVAALLFDGGLTTVPAATYSLIMFATALIFVAFLRRHAKA